VAQIVADYYTADHCISNYQNKVCNRNSDFKDAAFMIQK